MKMQADLFFAIGPNVWGRGFNLNEAIKNCKKNLASGNKKHELILYAFAKTHEDATFEPYSEDEDGFDKNEDGEPKYYSAWVNNTGSISWIHAECMKLGKGKF